MTHSENKMIDFRQDPTVNAIYHGIRRGIQVTVDNGCLGSAIILILSGIDTMAYLGMPEKQTEVKKDDFITWADRYINFPCKEQLTGIDLYGARCGMLHHYGVSSNLSGSGKCREIGYLDKSIPEVMYDPKVTEKLVLVSVPALMAVFFEGMDRFLIDTFSDVQKAAMAEQRLQNLVQAFPSKMNDGQ